MVTNPVFEAEIRLNFFKALRAFFFRVFLPTFLVYALFLYFINLEYWIDVTFVFIFSLKNELLWLSLLFVIPIYFISKDIAHYIFIQFFDILNAAFWPRYITIYKDRLFIRGLGFIDIDLVKSVFVTSGTIFISVHNSTALSFNFLKRFFYFTTVFIEEDEQKKTFNIQLFVDTDKLNVPAKDVRDMIPYRHNNIPHEQHVDWNYENQIFKSIGD